jgi:anti-anti-sigma regulatory factor
MAWERIDLGAFIRPRRSRALLPDNRFRILHSGRLRSTILPANYELLLSYERVRLRQRAWKMRVRASHGVNRVKMFIIEQFANKVIVTPHGDLDFILRGEFARILENVGALRGRIIIVSLLRCRCVDSSALVELEIAYRKIGSRLRVVFESHTMAARVFELLSFNFPIDSYDSVAKASTALYSLN